MSNRHSAGHRDANEPLITEIIKRYNVDYFLMSEGIGFDILLFTSPMICVEVKNPEQPISKRKLTPKEQDRKTLCAIMDIPYYVVETPERMAEIIRHHIQ
jgi:hypothetical protein